EAAADPSVRCGFRMCSFLLSVLSAVEDIPHLLGNSSWSRNIALSRRQRQTPKVCCNESRIRGTNGDSGLKRFTTLRVCRSKPKRRSCILWPKFPEEDS